MHEPYPQSAQEQQTSRHDEERAALTHKWQQERARLQRKLEHWNFEVLAQQREVNRLRQQLQQQGRVTAAGVDPLMPGGGR
jgi:chromosome segregation ATPase